jgi:CspA family cold shock protein
VRCGAADLKRESSGPPPPGVVPAATIVKSAASVFRKMNRGTVKWFNPKKGFGFIVDPTVNSDIFVHFSVIDTTGFRTLEAGEEVEYEMHSDDKGAKARKVLRL